MKVTFGEIQKYIDAGKLGGVSLSEVNAQTIHDAVKVTKVKAVEVELSLFSTDPLENGVAAACAQVSHFLPPQIFGLKVSGACWERLSEDISPREPESKTSRDAPQTPL